MLIGIFISIFSFVLLFFIQQNQYQSEILSLDSEKTFLLLFLISGVLIIIKTYELKWIQKDELDKIFISKTDKIKAVEANYIDELYIRDTEDQITGTVKLHIHLSDNKVLHYLVTPVEYFKVMKLLKKFVPEANFKLKTDNSPFEKIDDYPQTVDMLC